LTCRIVGESTEVRPLHQVLEIAVPPRILDLHRTREAFAVAVRA
jgi:hypothetical protein